MKKVVLATILGVFFAGSAMAAATEHTGVVKTWDAKTHTVTLEDGMIYILPTTFAADGIKVGEKVMVTFEVKDGKNMATAAVPAK